MSLFPASIAILAIRTVLPEIQNEGGLILKSDLISRVSAAIGDDRETAVDCLAYAQHADLIEIDGILVSE
jgi:hypothetical protein